MNQRGLSIIIISLLLSICIVNSTLAAQANPLPAVIRYDMEVGLSLGSPLNLSLPEASVDVTIAPASDISENDGFTLNHTINLESEFTILSDTEQNLTIGFAYPKDWFYQSSGSLEFSVSVNEAPTDFIILYGEDLEVNQEIQDNMNQELHDVISLFDELNIALFNATLSNNTENKLEVTADFFIQTSYEVILNFSYCVGSARTWESDTHEIVSISVVEPDVFQNPSFKPLQSLSVQNEASLLVGEWDIEISEFEYNIVSFSGTVGSKGSPDPSIWQYIPFIILGTGIVLCSGVFAYLKMKKS